MSTRGYHRERGEVGRFYGTEGVDFGHEGAVIGSLITKAQEAHQQALEQLTPEAGERDRGWKITGVSVTVEIHVEASR